MLSSIFLQLYIFFAVVPCILQLCPFFGRCAKIMYYSYIQFCWCANEITVGLFILQLCIQFVSCELFLQLYYFPLRAKENKALLSGCGMIFTG
jgi:hypothetical protein